MRICVKKEVILYIILGFILIGLLTGNLASWDIWADEACTIATIQKSFQTMTYATSIDVHPPCYYYIAWIIYNVIRFFVDLPVEIMIRICRLISLLPFVFLFLYMIKMTKCNVGFIAFPILMMQYNPVAHFSAEIRMYSWGTFFLVSVAMAILYIEYCNDNLKAWGALTGVTVLGCYTHYFVVIPLIIMWLIMGILHIKEKDFIKRYILFALVVIMAYIPWLAILYRQMRGVYESYWIAETDISMLRSIFYYITSISPIYRIILMLVLCFSCIISLTMIKYNEHRKIAIYSVIFMLMPYIVMGISYVIGKIYRPILFDRYIIPSLGIASVGQLIPILWLMNRKEKAAKLFVIPIMSVAMLLSVFNLKNFINEEREYGDNWKQMMSNIDCTNEKTFVYVGGGESLFRPLSIVYSNNKHLCTKPNKSEFSEVLFGIHPYSKDEISKSAYIFSGKDDEIEFGNNKVTLLGSFKLMYGEYSLYYWEEE